MIETMIQKAIEARENAYAPYSHFQVGVCLQGENGKLYTGCNVENSSFSATNCGERTAIFHAVSEGTRKFLRIVIVGGKENGELELCPPCGVCRQVMSEFCDPESFQVILATSPEKYDTYLLKELLPLQFGKEVFADENV
jgi:cytidine deaminase